ncbi:hypothetical protein [Cellulomonas sp. Leaf395]|uniref:hypothetical protein n=1 Tax=Cellulomonas sp. Leaf395 TaxID=1736362 RepID=UPI000A7985C3|nr:hypothetical protein [Cellulomonas sp. Leaf395]
MTVQGVARNRWLLRVLLGVATCILLTVLWSSTAAHASPDGSAQDEVSQGNVPQGNGPHGNGPHGNGLQDNVPQGNGPPDGLPRDDLATTPGVTPGGPPADPVAPVDDAVPPVAEAVEPAPAPATDAPVSVPVEEVLEPALPPAVEEPPAPQDSVPPLPPAEALAPETSTLPPVAEEGAAEVADDLASRLTPALVAPPSSTRPPLTTPRRRAPEYRPAAPAVPAAVPATAQDPCPPVAQPVVATARPVISWSRGLDGRGGSLPDDPPPVAVSPPSLEHLRSGSSRGDDPRPPGGPAAGLPTSQSAPSSSARARADAELRADVEPPQLRVLSCRAGPCPSPVPTPHVEILSSPA